MKAPGTGSKFPLGRFDWIALVVIVCIIAIGLFNLRNVDFYHPRFQHLHQAQLKWYLLGMVMAVMVTFVDLHLFMRLAYPLYGLGVLLLVLVLFAEPINNSRRWLPFFGAVIQPSEFMKLGVVLALSRYLHDERHERGYTDRHSLRTLIWPMLIMFAPVILIFAEPDLGTAIIVTLIGFSIIFFEGIRMRSVLAGLAVVALLFPLAWKFALHDYQKARVLVWWSPENLEAQVEELRKQSNLLQKAQESEDSAVEKKLEEVQSRHAKLKKILGKAYQPRQAERAIGSGEFYGKGGQQAVQQRQSALPELHTDFVIATWGEERGFIGASLLLFLYYLLVYWLARTTKFARNRFEALVAMGIAATVFWQFFVNVGMVTGVLPVVGVALPLLSYGGSSVVSTCIGLGLLFNIAIHRRR